MLGFFRRNFIALLALFIALGGTAYAANTVRSTDIVDGAVHTQDLANKAVTPAKSTGIWTIHTTSTQRTSDCATQAQTWEGCAGELLTVPAGHVYAVTVLSSVNANPGNANVAAFFCPASTGPSCMTGSADYHTFAPYAYGTASSSATGYYTAGTYTFSTAVKFPFVVPADSNAHTTTTLIATDLNNSPH